MTSRVDGLITQELRIFADDSPERRLTAIEDRLRQDPRRIRIAGLFAPDGRRVAGNVEALPASLVPDVPTNAMVVRIDNRGHESQTVRMAAHPLPNGEVLVVGRNIDELGEIADIVGRALALGLFPAFGLAVVIGMILSRRAHQRL